MSQVALQSAEDPLIGVTLDNKYRVTRIIGRGGMGVVYEAEHAALGNRVAIKLMLEKYTNDAEAMTRFTREAHASTRIGNPHIINVLDISTTPDGRAFVVMELLEGMPLSRLLEAAGALPPQRALSIMRQVLRAVGAAHAKGIVHRDLKPDNIFLLAQASDEGPDFVKLLDFGISKIIDPDLQAAATKLTTTGVVMGTPLYMAPEQAMGAEIDHHADIYACGVILYEMLAGKPPFEGQTYAVLVAKMLTTDAPLLGEVRPTLAPRLVAAVHRALEKEPQRRYASADAFIAALPSHQSASAVELAHTKANGRVVVRRPAQRGSRRWLALTVAAVVVTGVATAGVVLLRTPTATDAGSTNEVPAEVAAPPPEDRSTVEPIENGRLAVETQPAGAMLRVDGKPIATTPTSVVLDSGKHEIRLELAGYAPVATEIEISPGKDRPFFVQLVAVKEVAKTPPPKRPMITPSTLPRNVDVTPRPRDLTRPPPPPPIEKMPGKPPGMTGPRQNPYEPKPNPL